jgi:hypothetical protein
VSITRDAEIADEYFEEPDKKPDEDDPASGDKEPGTSSSGGGCNAGTLAAIALAAGVRALRGKRK